MNKFPKISIVTPSFNQADYLEQTILSIVDQGYPNLEYIIIDGGSTDGSVEIIKKYKGQISYWVSEKDDGLYHALQKGLEKSTGEIMGWLNSDDLFHKKSLFAIAKIFSAYKDFNWIMGKNSWFDETGFCLELKYSLMQESWSKWRLCTEKRSHIQQESTFWRRSLWQKTGGYISQDYKLAGDFDLWSRFFKHDLLLSCNISLSGFRLRNENQKSLDQIGIYKQEQDSIIAKHFCDSTKRVVFIKTGLFLIKIFPPGKFRNKLKTKLLKLSPVLYYEPRTGMRLIKPYKL